MSRAISYGTSYGATSTRRTSRAPTRLIAGRDEDDRADAEVEGSGFEPCETWPKDRRQQGHHGAGSNPTAPSWSISGPSVRDRKRLVGAEAIGPGANGVVVDGGPRIHIGQRFERQTPLLVVSNDPRRQGLFDDPRRRAIETIREFLDLFGQR